MTLLIPIVALLSTACLEAAPERHDDFLHLRINTVDFEETAEEGEEVGLTVVFDPRDIEHLGLPAEVPLIVNSGTGSVVATAKMTEIWVGEVDSAPNEIGCLNPIEIQQDESRRTVLTITDACPGVTGYTASISFGGVLSDEPLSWRYSTFDGENVFVVVDE